MSRSLQYACMYADCLGPSMKTALTDNKDLGIAFLRPGGHEVQLKHALHLSVPVLNGLNISVEEVMENSRLNCSPLCYLCFKSGHGHLLRSL